MPFTLNYSKVFPTYFHKSYQGMIAHIRNPTESYGSKLWKTSILLNWTYNVLNWCLKKGGFLSVCLPYMYRSPGKQECDLDVGYHIDGRQLLHGKSPQLPGSLPSQIRLDAGAAPCHWCLCSLVAKTRMAEWVSQCEIPSCPISW